ncbi:MAG TPA: dienelactone hydrolase family protein [Vicinamibacterales bacterium]|jgi:dienelactone hydrolase
MRTQDIAYKDGEVPLTGFLAWDDTRDDRRPGILVVHGGAGLDDHARNRARRLAGLGYVAFACDMYGDGIAGDRQRIMARIAELRSAPDRLSSRAQAGLDQLASHPRVDGRVAAVGYCFGGMTVLELARAGADLAGVVSVHGSLLTPRPARDGTIRASVLVCHGALDPHVPLAQVTTFIEEMNGARADWQLIAYGNAMHGFTHEDAASHPMPGVAYDARTDARSWTAMHTFFEEVFALDRHAFNDEGVV